VRTIKNRFGAANELGIFEMASTGLRAVEKPSALFLSHADSMSPGSAVLCCLEGSRPLLVEIQALVSRTHFGTPRRLATGVDPQRLALVSAVLEKRLGVNLWDQDIYLNVVGGLQVEEPAADLAIVAAIRSSLYNRPIARSTLVSEKWRRGSQLQSRHSWEADPRFKRGVYPTISRRPSQNP
jgi:DNA repair protein RadA/Sms